MNLSRKRLRYAEESPNRARLPRIHRRVMENSVNDKNSIYYRPRLRQRRMKRLLPTASPTPRQNQLVLTSIERERAQTHLGFYHDRDSNNLSHSPASKKKFRNPPIPINDFAHFVGIWDPTMDIFDISHSTTGGITMNSYFISLPETPTSKPICILVDGVKTKFFKQHLSQIKSSMNYFDHQTLDYFIVQHCEDDHAGDIGQIIETFPECKVFCTPVAKDFISNISNKEYGNIHTFSSDTELKLDGHIVHFLPTTMLHWPDTAFTFFPEIGMLTTCDFLGAHFCESIYVYEESVFKVPGYREAMWVYFDCIFAPLKRAVRVGLDKIRTFMDSVEYCCTSHGPLLRREDFQKIFFMYDTWIMEYFEKKSVDVLIVYTSVHNYTMAMQKTIAFTLQKLGLRVEAIQIEGLESQTAAIMKRIHNTRCLLLGSPTILNDAVHEIWDIAISLNKQIHQGLVVGAFGSYGWSGEAVGNITERFKQLALDSPLEPLRVHLKPDQEKLKPVRSWAGELGQYLIDGTPPVEHAPVVQATTTASGKAGLYNDGKLRRWKCLICGEIVVSVNSPELCGVCGAEGPEVWIEMEDDDKPELSEEEAFTGHIVIIGAGASGVSACKTARKNNKRARITMISNENALPYNRTNLTVALGNSAIAKQRSFFIVDDEWLRDNSVDIMLGCDVESADFNLKKLEITQCYKRNESMDAFENYAMEEICQSLSVTFDKLIISTGAHAFIPMKGALDHENVIGLRTARDLWKINSLLSQPKAERYEIVIVGAGVLALEAVDALLKRENVHISILIRSSFVLSAQVGRDKDVSEFFIEEMRKRDVNVLTNESVAELVVPNGSNSVSQLRLKSGSVIDCSLLMFSVGARANAGIARDLGLDVDRGIVVDRGMRCFVDGIATPLVYACGDCAQPKDVNYAMLWSNAINQGAIAGFNAAGGNKELENQSFPCILHCFDTQMFSVGSLRQAPTDMVIKQYTAQNLKKVLLNGGVIKGGFLIGNVDNQMKLKGALDSEAGVIEAAACMIDEEKLEE
ncbi:hypothetical protein PCE1_001665 [Barthelona sp. PCE]